MRHGTTAHMRSLCVWALTVTAVWLTAFASMAAGAGPYGGPPPGAGLIEMRDNEFGPVVLRVNPGATAEWRNGGHIAHSVTSDDGLWDSGLLQSGATFRYTFTQPGVYRYYCVPHGARGIRGMAGVVVVGDVALPSTAPAARLGPGQTLRVPADHPTIQAAVDAANPGSLILIAPGVYVEAVVVTTPGLTLRGLDRNRVILDGRFSRANGVKVVGADGVVIENMTARHFTANGFFWTGVRGYRGSYLTTYNNGEYGLYAFDSVFGRFDHSYASGHPDSGFYIGQCKPCHAEITDVLAEGNALGYSGTNAGGGLTIRRSVWRFNGAGIVPNTLDTERLAPQDGATIVDNIVYSNHNRDAPAAVLQQPAFGNGILVAGGVNNLVEGNRVWDHPNYGILIIGNVDQHFWMPRGNQVRGNTVWTSGRADLALAAPAGSGNCFAGNRFRRSRPPRIEAVYACGSSLSGIGGGDPAAFGVILAQFVQAELGPRKAGDWRTYPAPPPQPQMPDPQSVPAAAYPGPASADSTPQATPAGVPAAELSVVPQSAPPETDRFVLYAAQVFAYPLAVIAVAWDAVRRRRLAAGRAAMWIGVAVLIPIAGALLYFWRRYRGAGR